MSDEWELTNRIEATNADTSDAFGREAQIYGNYAVIGAPNTSVNNNNDSGSAYVFKKENGSWSQMQQIYVTSDPSTNLTQSYFGESVAIYGDYIIAGAHYGHTNDNGTARFYSGAAYIFKKEDDGSGGLTWNQKAILRPDTIDTMAEFGIKVDMYGDYAVIGAHYGMNTVGGKAYIFKKDSGAETWSQTAQLVGADSADDEFGSAVSIYNNYVIVGARNEDVNGKDKAGAAHIFKKDDGAETWTKIKSLYPTSTATSLNFGTSVSIYGDYAVVGEPNNSEGYAYIYKNDGADNWSKLTTDLQASDKAFDDDFGYSVSIYGDYIVVGAPKDDGTTNDNKGALYVYKVDATGNWNEIQKITTSEDDAADYSGDNEFLYYGWSANIHDGQIIVGAQWEDSNNKRNSGAAYIYNFVVPPPALSSIGNLSTKFQTNKVITLSSTNFSTVTYTSTSSDTNKVTVSVSGSELTMAPVGDFSGNVDITVNADYGDSQTDTETFTLTVNEFVRTYVYRFDLRFRFAGTDSSGNPLNDPALWGRTGVAMDSLERETSVTTVINGGTYRDINKKGGYSAFVGAIDYCYYRNLTGSNWDASWFQDDTINEMGDTRNASYDGKLGGFRSYVNLDYHNDPTTSGYNRLDNSSKHFTNLASWSLQTSNFSHDSNNNWFHGLKGNKNDLQHSGGVDEDDKLDRVGSILSISDSEAANPESPFYVIRGTKLTDATEISNGTTPDLSTGYFSNRVVSLSDHDPNNDGSSWANNDISGGRWCTWLGAYNDNTGGGDTSYEAWGEEAWLEYAEYADGSIHEDYHSKIPGIDCSSCRLKIFVKNERKTRCIGYLDYNTPLKRDTTTNSHISMKFVDPDSRGNINDKKYPHSDRVNYVDQIEHKLPFTMRLGSDTTGQVFPTNDKINGGYVDPSFNGVLNNPSDDVDITKNRNAFVYPPMTSSNDQDPLDLDTQVDKFFFNNEFSNWRWYYYGPTPTPEVPVNKSLTELAVDSGINASDVNIFKELNMENDYDFTDSNKNIFKDKNINTFAKRRAIMALLFHKNPVTNAFKVKSSDLGLSSYIPNIKENVRVVRSGSSIDLSNSIIDISSNNISSDEALYVPLDLSGDKVIFKLKTDTNIFKEITITKIATDPNNVYTITDKSETFTDGDNTTVSGETFYFGSVTWNGGSGSGNNQGSNSNSNSITNDGEVIDLSNTNILYTDSYPINTTYDTRENVRVKVHTKLTEIFDNNPSIKYFEVKSDEIGLDYTIGKPMKKNAVVFKANQSDYYIIDNYVTSKKTFYANINSHNDFINLQKGTNQFKIVVHKPLEESKKTYLIKNKDDELISSINWQDGQWVTIYGVTIYFGGATIPGTDDAITAADPYVFPINGNPYKLPDENANYCLYADNNTFITGTVSQLSKEKQEEMREWVIEKLGSDTNNGASLVTDGFFYSNLHINTSIGELVLDMETKICNSNNVNAFKVKVNNSRDNTYLFKGEYKTTVTISWEADGNIMSVDVDFFENPQIRNGIRMNTILTKSNPIGLLVEDYEPSLLCVENSKNKLSMYNNLGNSLELGKRVKDNKLNLQKKNELWSRHKI